MSRDSSHARHVFTIPAATPFLEALARTLLADPSLGGKLGTNISLADVTILLPTRRSVRALGDAFLRMGEGKSLLLPRIGSLGDVDEDELLLNAQSLAGNAQSLEGIERIPQAIEPLERQLRLARLILDLGEKPEDRDICRATALAADLAAFLDMVGTEQVDLKDLSRLVPDEFAENWQLTIEFLKLVTARWPQELEALGLVDPAIRRNLLLEAQARSLGSGDIPKNPIIAAGSTGTIPATATLLEAISRLPNGAIVLPGLDLVLDEDSFESVPHSHPQYGMRQLLTRLGLSRSDVSPWPDCTISDADKARARFLSEAMRPAETTEKWHDALPRLSAEAPLSLAGLSLCELETTRAESEAIALMMREVIETKGKTAALITPDRALARRVAMDLRRWNIEIDDSGGRSLSQTAPVAFFRLVADMVASDFAPIEFLACLKHPLAALGGDTFRLRNNVRDLELALLRGPRPAAGLNGLRKAIDADRDLERDERKRTNIVSFVDMLEDATAAFVRAMAEPEIPFTELLQTHVECVERLSYRDKENETAGLWAKEEGAAAADFLRELIGASPALGVIDPADYPQLFTDLGQGRVLRPRFGRHPRLFIWGPLEARLQHADRVILGGLNEGTWPSDTKIDPWLNRPMRKALGLEPPEQRIGLAAHDFVEGASAAEVILTRALKVDGAPTVASRWLLRLQGLVKGMSQADQLPAPHWQDWAARLDASEVAAQSLSGPRPVPPVETRPTEFSVTEIETLIRDPYAIYARHVLDLRPLEAIDADVAAAERGTIIHKALEQFSKAYPDKMPADALGELLRIGRDVFAETMDRPAVATFWWPRFERLAEWFIESERKYRATMTKSFAEQSGRIRIDGLTRETYLRGRADRMDMMDDGRLRIIDYKTGGAPSQKEVDAGLSPQLPLEAAMAKRGAFETFGKVETAAMLYIRLTGAEHKPGEVKDIPVEDLPERTWHSLISLLLKYENPKTPYLSNPRPQFLGRFADYNHLARVKEWSAGGEGVE